MRAGHPRRDRRRCRGGCARAHAHRPSRDVREGHARRPARLDRGDLTVTTASFDPALYKQTTKVQWDDAAEAWHRWGPFLERWLGEATELMLDLAGVDGGSVI